MSTQSVGRKISKGSALNKCLAPFHTNNKLLRTLSTWIVKNCPKKYKSVLSDLENSRFLYKYFDCNSYPVPICKINLLGQKEPQECTSVVFVFDL